MLFNKFIRVDGCDDDDDSAAAVADWELFVVETDLCVLLVRGRLSSFSKSLLKTWLRERLIRRLRLVRFRSRKGFKHDDDAERNNGNDNGWDSSVEFVELEEQFDSLFIDN